MQIKAVVGENLFVEELEVLGIFVIELSLDFGIRGLVHHILDVVHSAGEVESSDFEAVLDFIDESIVFVVLEEFVWFGEIEDVDAVLDDLLEFSEFDDVFFEEEEDGVVGIDSGLGEVVRLVDGSGDEPEDI